MSVSINIWLTCGSPTGAGAIATAGAAAATACPRPPLLCCALIGTTAAAGRVLAAFI